MDDSICPAQFLDIKEKVLDTIHKHLTPSQSEKEEHGAVYTPINIICNHLSPLPTSVWKNKNLLWLDPANGIGNYPVIIYYKLLASLRSQFSSENECSKHIIENMLFMIELNPSSVTICKRIFKMLDADAVPNIYRGDFLKDRELMHTSRNQKPLPRQFDIIVGNPPYNTGGIKSHTSTNTGTTIWPDFVDDVFTLVKQDGWLVFITPLSWLRKSHDMHTLLLEKHIVWMTLWDDSQSKSIIKADIPISLYVLHNKLNSTKKETCIISIIKRQNINTLSTIYLDPSLSIPLAFHSIFDKLHKFILSHHLQLDVLSKTVKCTGKEIILPKKYSLSDNFGITTYRVKDGMIVKKMIEPHPDIDKNKLIIANKRSFIGSFIDNGSIGLCGSDKFYILGNHLDWLLSLLSFRISLMVSSFIKYRQSFLDREAFTFLPDIRKLGKKITEDELYDLLKLTPEEIKDLERFSNGNRGDGDDIENDNEETEGRKKSLSRKKQSQRIKKHISQRSQKKETLLSRKKQLLQKIRHTLKK